MSDDTTVQTKAELLERIDRAWRRFDQRIGQLSPVQLERPGGPDGWAVKDHLFHLSAWQRKVIAMMQGRPAHEGLGVDADTYATFDEQRINAALYARHRQRPAAEAVAELRQTHQLLLDSLAGLTDADLARPYYPDKPDGRRLLDGVAANTFEHYAEHLPWIEQVLAQPH